MDVKSANIFWKTLDSTFVLTINSAQLAFFILLLKECVRIFFDSLSFSKISMKINTFLKGFM